VAKPPITYEIRTDLRLVVARCRGTLRTQNILDYVQALTSDPRLEEGMSELIDLRGVTIYDVDAEGIRSVVASDRENAPELQISRCALVSPEDFVYGMLRMYELYSGESGTEVAAFRSMEEATTWLGIPSDVADPRTSSNERQRGS